MQMLKGKAAGVDIDGGHCLGLIDDALIARDLELLVDRTELQQQPGLRRADHGGGVCRASGPGNQIRAGPARPIRAGPR